MGKRYKKKQPVTFVLSTKSKLKSAPSLSSVNPPASQSIHSTKPISDSTSHRPKPRQLISQLHNLNKTDIQTLKEDPDSLALLNKYQKASIKIKSTEFTSKWFIGFLCDYLEFKVSKKLKKKFGIPIIADSEKCWKTMLTNPSKKQLSSDLSDKLKRPRTDEGPPVGPTDETTTSKKRKISSRITESLESCLRPQLSAISLPPPNPPPFEILDVGALSGLTYLPYKELGLLKTITSIDLNPQDHLVRRLDFFDLPEPSLSTGTSIQSGTETGIDTQFVDTDSVLLTAMNSSNDSDSDYADNGSPANIQTNFDIVCLSLVLNFLGSPSQRLLMLEKATRHLSINGLNLMYIVLPLPCLRNSRYMTEEFFVQRLMNEVLCCELLAKKETRKLWCGVFKYVQNRGAIHQKSKEPLTKVLLNDGYSRNNFWIG
ncbi:putative methyltransferase-domain-containing protein [Paraphysoderma sedebokerense]|nr:putative methyltransferase-domain-containing protein [Paraphysoderma sedebokerense]